jgi:hypothetical protein
MRSVTRAAAVALAAAALGSGCSGGTSGASSTAGSTAALSTTTRPTAPKTDFATKADTVCEKWQNKIDAVPPPADPSELASTMKQTIPLTEKELAELRKLEPPPDRTATAANFLDALDRTVAALKQYVRAAAADDGDAAQQALLDGDEQTDNARRLAGELGLTVCGAKR